MAVQTLDELEDMVELLHQQLLSTLDHLGDSRYTNAHEAFQEATLQMAEITDYINQQPQADQNGEEAE